METLKIALMRTDAMGRCTCTTPRYSQELTIIQVLGPEQVTTQLGSGLDHHRIPEAQYRLLLKRNGRQHIIGGRRKDLPGRKLPNAVGGLVKGEGWGTLRVTVTKNSCST